MGSFNSKKKLGFKPEDYRMDDFPWDHPLRMVAALNMGLAVSIIQKYGGVNMYVPQFETICEGPKRRLTKTLLAEGYKTSIIAEKVGFSPQKVRQIRRDEYPEDVSEQPAG